MLTMLLEMLFGPSLLMLSHKRHGPDSLALLPSTQLVLNFSTQHAEP